MHRHEQTHRATSALQPVEEDKGDGDENESSETALSYFSRGRSSYNIQMADIDPMQDAAVASIHGKQRVIPTTHTSTKVPSLFDHVLF